MRFDLSDPTFQGILIAFIGGLLVVLFVYMLKLLRKSGSEIFSRLKRGKRGFLLAIRFNFFDFL